MLYTNISSKPWFLIMGNHCISLLFCVLFICQTCFGCTLIERQALLELKASLKFDSADHLSSWSGEDCCDHWKGIICNNLTGHVEKLDLRNAFLTGDINGHALLKLVELQYLDLSSNDFLGIPIPSFLGSLKNLKYLNLSTAGFGGEIPRHLGNLSDLEHLDLSFSTGQMSSNNLRWISGLSSLKTLDLSWVNLAECSQNWLDSVKILPSLLSLKLRSCQLAGSGSSSTLSSIQYNNNLSSLVSLDLGENSLNSTTFPFWKLNLGNQLQFLRLDGNSFEGSLPSESFENLTSLTLLDLSINFFNASSIPSSLCNNHSDLISINLAYNQFQGSLPLCIGNLSSLRSLNLTNNKLVGEIPSELGGLKGLTAIDLSTNSFRSSIPSSLGQLTELKHLYLQQNQLYGPIPSTLGKLRNLQELDLSNNSLVGELSESHFENLKSLKILSLSHNLHLNLNVSSRWIPLFQLHQMDMDSVVLGTDDQFPNWIQSQRNISILSLANCSISSTIPDWFRTMSVQELYLSSNKIHGSLKPFPPEMHLIDLSKNNLSGTIDPLFDQEDISSKNLSLKLLKLGSNSFTGKIPNFLCNLSSLVILSLPNNQLSGGIPPCFGDMGKVVPLINVLDLSNNTLSGPIPSTLGNVNAIMYLHLNKNKLSGVIPSALRKLIFLLTLDIGENQLTGTIPDWIGNEIPSLRFLRLQSNNFHGNISAALCQLNQLQVLNLAENNLVGRIPRCLFNLTMMASNDQSSYLFSFDTYSEALSNIAKGIELEYTSNLVYVKSLSLSANKLQGAIPDELMELQALQSLNLSSNNLSGKIPEKIGNLNNLESLDLAKNILSGHIPPGLATIDTLSYLNMSFNNLSGRIPSSNHFDTLIFNNQSIFKGNDGLCGKPLANSCPDDQDNDSDATSKGVQERVDEEIDTLWFSAGVAPGFVAGLLGFFTVLYFKKSWNLAYLNFLEKVYHALLD